MSEDKIKKNKTRSPNYPAISLPEAIEKIKGLYQADGRAGSPKKTAFVHLGYGGANGKSLGVISALKKYGLIVEENDRILLTEDSFIVLLSTDEKKKLDIIQKLALNPELYNLIWGQYHETGLPSDESLREDLIFGHQFNENSVSGFIKDFRATIEFAKLRPSEKPLKGKDAESSKTVDNFDISTGNSMNATTDTNTPTNLKGYKDFIIPQKGKESVFLRVPKPISTSDIETIKKWLELFGDTLVDDIEATK
jgi:hypothetical protein